jgi:hypothetical protein
MVSPRPRLSFLLALFAALAVVAFACPSFAAVHHHPTSLHRSSGSLHSRVGHASAYVPGHAARGVIYIARPGRHSHNAAKLRRARHHGTAAFQAAAREAQMDSARTQTPIDQPRETASLELPLAPIQVMNLPPMRGTHESLVRQNQRADQEGLARVRDDADITALLHNGLLVPLPTTNGMRSDPRLPENRRYCRPWTAHFLAELARAHAQRFHDGLQINSAVRTVEYQRHLLRINGNAAPADGDIASPHLTGATIDIGKKGMSSAEIAWMRSYLSPLEAAGKIDVEEEFYQSCFHISVYQSYQGAVDVASQTVQGTGTR